MFIIAGFFHVSIDWNTMKQHFLRHGTKDLPNSSLLAKHPYVRQFFQHGSKEFDSILEHQNNHDLCISIGTNMSSTFDLFQVLHGAQRVVNKTEMR